MEVSVFYGGVQLRDVATLKRDVYLAKRGVCLLDLTLEQPSILYHGTLSVREELT